MAKTESTMLALGTEAPDFELPDVVSGQRYALGIFAGKKGLLVMFLSRHCPYVQHLKEALARLGRDYERRDVALVAISSNDVTSYPDDAPDMLRGMAAELGLTFPFLYDETQQTAKAFRAACTPDFFLFDGERKLLYRGQFDDSRPGNEKPVTGKDLRQAIEALLADRPQVEPQLPSLGCNIKWRPGNEPPYFP